MAQDVIVVGDPKVAEWDTGFSAEMLLPRADKAGYLTEFAHLLHLLPAYTRHALGDPDAKIPDDWDPDEGSLTAKSAAGAWMLLQALYAAAQHDTHVAALWSQHSCVTGNGNVSFRWPGVDVVACVSHGGNLLVSAPDSTNSKLVVTHFGPHQAPQACAMLVSKLASLCART